MSLLIPGSYSLSVLLPIVVGTVPMSRRRRHLPPAPAPGIARQAASPSRRRALPAPPLPPALALPADRRDAEPDPAPPYDVLDLPPSYTESIESAVGDLARNHNSFVEKKADIGGGYHYCNLVEYFRVHVFLMLRFSLSLGGC